MKKPQQLNLSLLQEDIPANLLQQQEKERVKRILETSGQKCLDLSRNSNLYGFLQKMLLDTSHWAWTKFYMTWKMKTTPHKHLLFQLKVSEQINKETEFLLFPTPQAHEARLGYQRRDTGKKGTQKSLSTIIIEMEGGREKTTGQLNPMWVEWKALGNSIVPQIAEIIGKAIISHEEQIEKKNQKSK